MAYEATHRYAKISPRKVRPLADLIRGKFADEALEILRFQPHRGARLLEKVLHSALANAEDQRAVDLHRCRRRVPRLGCRDALRAECGM